MPQKQYVFPTRVAISHAERVEAQRMSVDFMTDKVTLEWAIFDENQRRVGSRTTNHDVSDLDGVVGKALRDEILKRAPVLIDGVPSGGTIEDKSGLPGV